MIVIDASVLVLALLVDGPAREAASDPVLHAPHLIDAEVASAVRRRVLVGQLDSADGWLALDGLSRLGLVRHPVVGVLARVWELRNSVSSYDACYVATAEALDLPLVTADARLTRAPGLRCAVTLVPG